MASQSESKVAVSTVGDVAMSEVLDRVALELNRITGLAQTLQVTLSPLLVRSEIDAAAAQDLDELTQLVEGLATFVTDLAKRCPEPWRAVPADSASSLGLYSQKLRLCSCSAPQVNAVESGSFELL